MRLLSFENLRWVVRHRAWTPYYLKRYWRFAWFKLRHPQVITEGFVFLGKKLEIVARPGHGRIVLGKWVHLGDETRLRAHEGTLRIGDKVVFARDVTVNCYLDVEIGASTLVADWTYICDFDHKTDDLGLPIKDQGLVKSPVRIGPDCWLATKVTVTRGTDIGRGAVIGANSVARGNIPEYAVAVGIPAVVVRDRVTRYADGAERREYLAGLARENEETAARLRAGLGPTGGAEVTSVAEIRPPRGAAGGVDTTPAGNRTSTSGDALSGAEGFSSYSPVGQYVPEVVGEESPRG
ncbi:acyltransferase [Kribbella lupini]|uniref:Acetyltransferase-like isoleucine patch superfamily enzyme n=1 Tax=Kribbella lupini TaxID=291602 RepID=A0ABN2BMF2_9ACTN